LSTRAYLVLHEMKPEISDALRIARNLSDAVVSDRRMSEQESQLRFVVVALISALQAYLRELLEERADQLAVSWNELSEIEKRYVGVQSLKRMTEFFEEDSDKELADSKRVDALRIAILDCAAWQEQPSLLARSPHRQKLDGFLQNNGSKVLDRIISYHSACELSFFDWLSKFHAKYRGLADALDIVIATRNDVCHGTFARRVTMRDVRKFRVLVYRMVAMIEPYIAARKDGSAPLDPSRTAISERAYYRWLERGRGDHNAADDWLSAEKELKYWM
jgi:hypothetical protein